MTTITYPPEFKEFAKTQWEKVGLFNKAQQITPNSVCFPWMIVLDMKNFDPGDIKIKAIDDFIIVKGHHREKLDEFGSVERYFTRKCFLPEGNGINSIRASYISKSAMLIAVFLEAKNFNGSKPLDEEIAKKNKLTKNGYIQPFSLQDYFVDSPLFIDDDFDQNNSEQKELADFMERVMFISDTGLKRGADGKPLQMETSYLDTVKATQDLVNETFDKFEINHDEAIEASINAALQRVESQLAMFARNNGQPNPTQAPAGDQGDGTKSEQMVAVEALLDEADNVNVNINIFEEVEMILEDSKQCEENFAQLLKSVQN